MSAPTVALYPATPLTTSPSDAVVVQSDEPYSIFDHLFYPQMRSPTFLFASGSRPHVGLVLGGGDRLGLQRWSLAGYVQPGGDKAHYGANVAYLNYMLAPVYVVGNGGFLDWVDPTPSATDPDLIFDVERRTRDASLMIGTSYRGSVDAAIGGVFTDDHEEIGSTSLRRYVGGPSATVTWYSAETTRYTGPRRALQLEGQLAYYPDSWSTFMGDIVDLGATFGFTLPLPLGRQHTISAFARARSLITDGETGLLQVGGDSALGSVWNRSNKPEPMPFDDTRNPPGLRFVEPLRGFEDFAITSDRVKLGEVSWKYPLIIDRGTAALWFLPATYLRQLDLELFATVALVDANDRHHAVGAAATLRIQFLRLPLAVTYQIARRLSDDLALTQLVAIGAEL